MNRLVDRLPDQTQFNITAIYVHLKLTKKSLTDFEGDSACKRHEILGCHKKYAHIRPSGMVDLSCVHIQLRDYLECMLMPQIQSNFVLFIRIFSLESIVIYIFGMMTRKSSCSVIVVVAQGLYIGQAGQRPRGCHGDWWVILTPAHYPDDSQSNWMCLWYYEGRLSFKSCGCSRIDCFSSLLIATLQSVFSQLLFSDVSCHIYN